MLNLKFSSQPGAHERHLIRAWNNPLFDGLEIEVTEQAIEAAQMRDRLEADRFLESFHSLVERVVSLDAKVESDIMLELKQELDKSYEVCSGLGGEMDEIKSAIRELLEVIVGAIRKGAGDDQQALQNLAEEDLARTLHFELLAYPLVADLLRPDSPVESEALVPSVLSESLDAVPAVMSLFTPDQAQTMHAFGESLLDKLADANEPALEEYRNKLNIMARAATQN